MFVWLIGPVLPAVELCEALDRARGVVPKQRRGPAESLPRLVVAQRYGEPASDGAVAILSRRLDDEAATSIVLYAVERVILVIAAGKLHASDGLDGPIRLEYVLHDSYYVALAASHQGPISAECQLRRHRAADGHESILAEPPGSAVLSAGHGGLAEIRSVEGAKCPAIGRRFAAAAVAS